MRYVVIACIVLAILGGVLYWSARTPAVNSSRTSLQPEEVITNSDRVLSDGTIIKPDGTIIRPNTNTSVPPQIVPTNTAPVSKAQYLPYSESTFTSAKEALVSNGGQLLLYFHVDWSKVCQELDQDIAASLDDLPGNLVILKADFEKDIVVRQEYGVAYEHSFVQVDSAGARITSWIGSSNAGDIPRFLK